MLIRIEKARKLLEAQQLEGLLIAKPENRKYFSGFTGTSGFLLITRSEALFMTDFRYVDQAVQQCEGYRVVKLDAALTLEQAIGQTGIKQIGFEDSYVTVSFFNQLRTLLPEVSFVGQGKAIETIRRIKDEEEIAMIAKAAAIADQAFEHILHFLKPGAKEADIALELEFFMKKLGASGLSFTSIVASGVRSSMPHGVASDKLIEAGDFVTLDFGCIYSGYCSDMTRTVVIGPASDKQKEIYYTVLEAQEAALKKISAGIPCQEVDKVARDIISSKGYGEYFGHGLGHGVGLEIHEDPRLSPAGDIVLEANMVITDEPGIYLPGFGGVRIEDLVVVKENGSQVLSKSPKHLIEL